MFGLNPLNQTQISFCWSSGFLVNDDSNKNIVSIKIFETSVISAFIKNDRLYREAWVPRLGFYVINTELVRRAATESSPSDNYLANFLK